MATQRTSNAYFCLLSQLKCPSTYLPVPSTFQSFLSHPHTYFVDLSKPNRSSFFQLEPHHQHLLRPVPAFTIPSTTSASYYISQHKASLVQTPQLHDYSHAPYLFYRLSRSRLPSNILLPCAYTADFQKMQALDTDLVSQRLERWSSHQDLILKTPVVGIIFGAIIEPETRLVSCGKLCIRPMQRNGGVTQLFVQVTLFCNVRCVLPPPLKMRYTYCGTAHLRSVCGLCASTFLGYVLAHHGVPIFVILYSELASPSTSFLYNTGGRFLGGS